MALDGKESVQENMTQSKSVMTNVKKGDEGEKTKIETTSEINIQ